MSYQIEAHTIGDFARLLSPHYHCADYFSATNEAIEPVFRMEVVAAGQLSVGLYRGSDLAARREWRHIRRAQSSDYFIRIPLKGSLYYQQDHSYKSHTDSSQLVITCSNRPFVVGCETGSTTISIKVPGHIMRSRLPAVDRLCGIPFAAESEDAIMARELFSGILSASERMSPGVTDRLAQAGLEALIDIIAREAAIAPAVDNRRLAAELAILDCIDANMTTPGLTAAAIAEQLGISLRMLHYRMKRHGTTFRDLLLKRRLDQAKIWLADPAFRHFSVEDLAFLVGFSSVSHFSASFQARFGYRPGRRAVQTDNMQ